MNEGLVEGRKGERERKVVRRKDVWGGREERAVGGDCRKVGK